MAQTDSRLHPMLAAAAADRAPIRTSETGLVMYVAPTVVIAGDQPDISPDATLSYVAIDVLTDAGAGAAVLDTLTALGLESGGTAGRVVSGLMPIDAIAALETVDGLVYAQPVMGTTFTGSRTSQGDRSMNADLARSITGLDGSGVTVGMLSDSFDTLNGAAQDVATGDLPADFRVIDESPTRASDEGRALAQVVHDIAPGADILFATAFTGRANYANNIRDLADAGADVIFDDVSYLNEPFFQDGILAQAVDDVTAQGAVYLSSAGNQGRASYEAAFRDSGLMIDASPNASAIAHDWDPGPGVDPVLDFTLAGGDSLFVSFQWNEPFASASDASPGSASDLDIYLVDPDTLLPVRDSDGLIFGGLASNIGGDPVEFFRIENNTGQPRDLGLVIENAAGPDPDFMKIVFFDSRSFVEEKSPEYFAEFINPAIVGHTAATGTIAVGASAYFNTPAFGTDPAVINDYSSTGPTRILRDIDGALLPEPEIRDRPDITAPDGIDTTFFGQDFDNDGIPNFFGTSAAVPHAAGVVALMLEADPTLTTEEIRLILRETALDMGAPGYDGVTGGGLVQADAALLAVLSDDTARPVARDDTFRVSEDDLLAGSVFTDNGAGPDETEDGSAFTVSSVNGLSTNVGETLTLDSGALVTLSADGQISYAPGEAANALAPDETATDTITYTIRADGSATDSAAAIVTVIVDGVNDAPVAAPDMLLALETVPLVANLYDDNGAGPDIDPEDGGFELVSYELVGESLADADPIGPVPPGTEQVTAFGGTISVNLDGTLIYIADPARLGLSSGESITERIAYTIADGFGAESTATATITVQGTDITLSILAETAEVTEGDVTDVTARFLIERDGGLNDEIEVDYTVTGTGPNPADAEDFVGASLPSGTLTFMPGDTALTLDVDIAGDTDREADETFVVTLSDPRGGSDDVVLDMASASVIIRDTDLAFTLLGSNRGEKLKGGFGRDVIGGEGGNDVLKGKAGDDILFGGDGNDKVDGEEGNDMLFGEAGNDRVRGDDGDDWLDGGTGNDDLRGRGGADVFVFAPGYGTDTIDDFGDGADRIDLTGFAGLSAEDFFTRAGQQGRDVVFTADTGDRLIIEKVQLASLDADDLIVG